MIFDYTSVTPESIDSVIDDAISFGNDIVEQVVGFDGLRTFANTMRPLEELAIRASLAYGRGPFLSEASADEEIRNTARAAEERGQKWQVELVFHRDLYLAVKAYAETDEATNLVGQERRLLDFTMRDFRRAGHELTEDQRTELRKHQERLVELSLAFSRNLAEYEDYLIVTPEDLDGLPDGYIDRLAKGEEPGTYKVSMDYPDVQPFQENARRRDLRQQLAFKFANQAVEKNRPILAEAVELRERIAQILGKPSWAHYGMEIKMAKRPEAVFEFYEGLIPALTKKGKEELANIEELLRRDGHDDIARLWDFRFYDTTLRREEYGVGSTEVSLYFSLDKVLEGMLDLTGEVLGLEYRKIEDTKAWHEDVLLYEIRDKASGDFMANFYADLFPREGKFTHAAAWPLVPGHRGSDGKPVRPTSAILTNFTKPTATRPSLLQHSEVVTLFHEFGHVLHMSLSQSDFVRFSGANTEWDFVEAPSQIMENWCWDAGVLSRFARHYETGAPIPTELVDKLVAARDLNVALLNLRQISFGWLDMALHGPRGNRDLDEINLECQHLTLFPLHEGTFFPASFGHLLGGYDAGYYGYLWSEVYGADMFGQFVERGITNPEVGAEYRSKILEPSGTKDAIDLLRDFLGREPSNEAFLTKLGITT